MPKKLEQALKAKANRMGLKGKQKDAYVYGALRETGWKPSKITDSSARTDSSVQASLQGCRPEIDLLTEWAKQTAVMLNEYGES